MNRIFSVFLLVTILVPVLATADELVPRFDVFAGAKAMQDPTTLIPDIYKPIEKEMRAYRVAREQYDVQAERALVLVLDIGARGPKSQSDLAALAQEIESMRLQLTRTYTDRQDLVKRMQSTPKGKALWQTIVDVRPEYNDALVTEYDTRFSNAITTLLVSARDMYRTLATHTTPFVTANGRLFFKTPEQTYTYNRFFVALRSAVKEMTTAQRDKYVFLRKQPGILSLYGDEYIITLERTTKEKNEQLEKWSRPAGDAPQTYAPLIFFLQLNKAVASDDSVTTLKQRMQTLRAEIGWAPAFRTEDIATTIALQKAQSRISTMQGLFQTYEKAVEDLSIRLGKELHTQYNMHRAVYAVSDADFAVQSDAALAAAYTRALLSYQKEVYSALVPCLATKGKKKCTVKVVDGITLQVSDKKMQKSLDTLKTAFLAMYKTEYERQKGK
jgi:hypothetical protein